MIALFQSLPTLLAALVVSGCATIFSSGPESIEVKSDPPGASFTFGRYSGTTPTMISVPRKEIKDSTSFYFKKEGYEDITVPITTHIQGITWLGILFWPSIVVDIASANAYKLDDPRISARLIPIQGSEPAENRAVQNTAGVEPTPYAPTIPSAQALTPTQNLEQVKKTEASDIDTGRPQNVEQLQAGVVKIIAKSSGGTAKLGTGFIVRLDKDVAYIVTASHVVAGDPQPKVEFFTKRNLPVLSEILGLEGDDEMRGLSVLVIRGSENLPKGLRALPLAKTVRFSGGEEVTLIGFPRNAGPWAVVKGNISSRQGRDLYFSPTVDSGHSGGPILQHGKVVGLVAVAGQSSGRGIIASSVHDYVEGFGITVQEHVVPR